MSAISGIPTVAIPSLPGGPAWEIALLFPEQGQWTEDEYLALDTNRMVELSDGCLEVLPMPTIFHQLLVNYLHNLLEAFVKAHAKGLVLFAPLPVRLWSGKIREPDIIYLSPKRLAKDGKYPRGADLVMEIVSEGAENRRRDLEIKPGEYAKAGISEYWLVDPQERNVTVLVLEGKKYRIHGIFVSGQSASSVLFPDFSVDVDAIFAAGTATA